MRTVALLSALLFSSTALAQSVQQSGVITPGHVPVWVQSNVIGDSGPATGSAVTEFGVTATGGLPLCVNNGPLSSPTYGQLCLSVPATGPAEFVINGASLTGLDLNLNGTIYDLIGSSFPGGPTGAIQYNAGSSFGGFIANGDATINTTTGAVTVTKTNGVAFAPSATTDTTNASNITSGNLSTSRLNNGSGASSSTFWRGDGTWATPPSGVSSVFGRTGAVAAQTGDYSVSQVTGAAPLASPTFTGTVAFPFASNGLLLNNTSGQISSLGVVNGDCVVGSAGAWVAGSCTGGGGAVSLTAGNTGIVLSPSTITSTGTISLGNPTASTLGGIESHAAVSHQWINAISTSGVPSGTQPACGDLSNGAASCSTDTTNAANISSGTLPAARLPTPTATTLGGVESYAAVTNQWINAISTSGVPSSTQPACGNLSNAVASCSTDTTNASNITSGTLPAARLPAPTAIALGGVESSTAGANQFATGINTSGNVTYAQPTFSNLSGSATLAQFPTIANNTALGNVSGSTAVPTALTTTQLTTLCNSFTSSLSGCAPASGGGTTNFLRADGSWAPAGAGSGVSSFNTRTGAVTSQSGDYTVGQVTGAAPLASPTFTGTVTLPDAAAWSSTGISNAGSYTTLTPFASWTPTVSTTFSTNYTGVTVAPTLTAAATNANTVTALGASLLLSGTNGYSGARAFTSQLNMSSFSGSLSIASGMAILSPVLGSTSALEYDGLRFNTATTHGTGITTGSILNTGVNVFVPAGAPASGGTIENSAFYIQGNGGSGAGTTNNFAIHSTSTAPSVLAGALSFQGSAGSTVTVTTQSGTTYTLTTTDCMSLIKFTSASAVTVTLPNSLPAGCQVAMEQDNTAQVTLSAASGATLHSAHSYTKTFGQYAIVGVSVNGNSGGSSAVYIMTGDGA